MSRPTALERFEAKVDRSAGLDACHLWTGNQSQKKGRKTYGLFYADGRTTGAHRWAYEHHTGEKIPAGMEILHQCDNPPCVNPLHLKLGTHAENMREVRERGNGPKPRGLTECPKGHEYTEANTYIYDGYRSCRRCRAEAWHRRKKAA